MPRYICDHDDHHHHKRIGPEPVGQNIRIVTSLTIEQPDTSGRALIIRRVCTLTLEVEYRIGMAVAFSRTRVYKFDPDLAYDRMDELQCGIKTGRFLYNDTWSVHDPFVRYDPHAPTEIIVEDYADVLKWFGADFNPATETPDKKQLPNGKELPPPGGRSHGRLVE